MISLKASGDTDGAKKMKVMILQKALPKIFHKINVLLRLQNELKLVDSSFQENLVTLVEHFSSIGLTKFPEIKFEVQVLVERLLHSILVKRDMTMFDRLRKATVATFSSPANSDDFITDSACTNIMRNCSDTIRVIYQECII